MAGRVTRWAPWITVAGVVALLLGLSWDAVLHKLDPELAQREGIFTLTNPGHVLFGGGIATHIRVGSPLFTHILFGLYLGLFVWGGLYLRSGRLRELIPLTR